MFSGISMSGKKSDTILSPAEQSFIVHENSFAFFFNSRVVEIESSTTEMLFK